MAYTYQDMVDKTKEGIILEVESGLGTIAAHMAQTHGLPLEHFKLKLEKDCPTNIDKLLFYMTYRSEFPDIFN